MWQLWIRKQSGFVERNRIAAECLAGQPVIVNDLFSLMIDHPEYYGEDDGVHPKAEGGR